MLCRGSFFLSVTYLDKRGNLKVRVFMGDFNKAIMKENNTARFWSMGFILGMIIGMVVLSELKVEEGTQIEAEKAP